MVTKIIVNGYPNSGKNTFIQLMDEILKRENIWIYEYDTVEIYKNILKYNFGWDGEKTEKARKAISDLKKIDVEFRDGPFIDLVEELDSAIEYRNETNQDEFFFIHCREPEEIRKIKEKYPDMILVKIKSDRSEICNNSSDMSVNNIYYDYEIDNSGEWGELREKAEKFYKWVKEGQNE